MLELLRQKNQRLLSKYHENKDYKNETTQKMIEQLLKHDDCFLRMSIEHAFTIFRELNCKRELFEDIYLAVTKPAKRSD